MELLESHARLVQVVVDELDAERLGGRLVHQLELEEHRSELSRLRPQEDDDVALHARLAVVLARDREYDRLGGTRRAQEATGHAHIERLVLGVGGVHLERVAKRVDRVLQVVVLVGVLVDGLDVEREVDVLGHLVRVDALLLECGHAVAHDVRRLGQHELGPKLVQVGDVHDDAGARLEAIERTIGAACDDVEFDHVLACHVRREVDGALNL